jgi:hypothetical protein
MPVLEPAFWRGPLKPWERRILMHGGCGQVEDGVCVPGLTFEPVGCTADVEAAMCRASRQQHDAASHLVLSVYVACKEHAAGKRGCLLAVPMSADHLPCMFCHAACLHAACCCSQTRQAQHINMPRNREGFGQIAHGEPGILCAGGAQRGGLPPRAEHLPAGALITQAVPAQMTCTASCAF